MTTASEIMVRGDARKIIDELEVLVTDLDTFEETTLSANDPSLKLWVSEIPLEKYGYIKVGSLTYEYVPSKLLDFVRRNKA